MRSAQVLPAKPAVCAQEGDAEQAAGVGELHVRGRQLFKEYWTRPDATAKDLSPDGWFRCLLLVIRGSQSPEALVLWCMLVAFSMELLMRNIHSIQEPRLVVTSAASAAIQL